MYKHLWKKVIHFFFFLIIIKRIWLIRIFEVIKKVVCGWCVCVRTCMRVCVWKHWIYTEPLINNIKIIHCRLACATRCSLTIGCVSYNYCGGRICHLNSATINDNFAISGITQKGECLYVGVQDGCANEAQSSVVR